MNLTLQRPKYFSVEFTVLAGTFWKNSALCFSVETACLLCLITNIHAMCHLSQAPAGVGTCRHRCRGYDTVTKEAVPCHVVHRLGWSDILHCHRLFTDHLHMRHDSLTSCPISSVVLVFLCSLFGTRVVTHR